jgi:hypothetical protein
MKDTFIRNNSKVPDPGKVSVASNSLFLIFNKNLNMHQVQKADAITLLKDMLVGKCPGIKIIPVTDGEIKNLSTCTSHSSPP